MMLRKIFTDLQRDYQGSLSLSLKDDELAFYQSLTGIQDIHLLSQHILAIQSQAYAVHPYQCIRSFAFTSLKISRHPDYQRLLDIGSSNADAIFLDLGCCFGNDARKAISDGFPSNHVYASDLRQEFWDMGKTSSYINNNNNNNNTGHKLFKSTSATCPIHFIQGNVFDTVFLPEALPVNEHQECCDDSGSGTLLSSLGPLLHRVNAIHTSSFFHLFDEQEQYILAQRLAGLLSPEPGSIIFGSHLGGVVKGEQITSGGQKKFAHSPESWDAMWDGKIFKKATVECRTVLKEAERKAVDDVNNVPLKMSLLVWSITRK